MRKIVRNALTATAAVAATAALTTVPASAAPATWTVTPGGNITGANTQPLRALNTDKGVAAVCPVSTAAGTLKSGPGLDGNGIASLTSVAATGCVTTGGLATVITPTGTPWTFNALNYDGSDVVEGELTGVQATAVIGNPAQCTVTVGAPGGGGATITGTYTNSTDRLAVSGSNLVVLTATGAGCGSLASPGDSITLGGEYGLTGANADQTITSP